MTDFELFLAAITSGDYSALPTPNTKIEKYLAKALGIWDGELPKPTCDADVYLYAIAEQGVGGDDGGLPALTNPATAAEILAGYEAINASGVKLTGTHACSGDGGEEFYITDGQGLFQNNARLDIYDQLIARCKGLTNISNMFSSCSQLPTTYDASRIDTSLVTNMSNAFWCASNTVTITGLDTWDTSKVTTMVGAFYGCTKLQSIGDLSNWDTSKVESMASIFQNCRKLKEITGLSAAYQPGVVVGFPYGTASSPAALSRLTFKAPAKAGALSFAAAINIKYCSIEADAFREMADSLQDLTIPGAVDQTCISEYDLIIDISMLIDSGTITEDTEISVVDGDGTVYTGIAIDVMDVGYLTHPDGYDISVYDLAYPLTIIYQSESALSSYSITITGNPCITGTLADGTACDTLTDEDRALATDKGWTLVE